MQASVPILMVLCLLSYQFKHVVPWNATVDITVALEGLLIVLLSVLLTQARFRRALEHGDLAILLGFTSYLFLSRQWAIGGVSSYQKALSFLYYVVPAYCWARLLGGPHIHTPLQERFLGWSFGTVLLLAFIVSAGQFWQAKLMGQEALDIFGANYLVTGQTIGFGFLLLVFWFVPQSAHQDGRTQTWPQKALLLSGGLLLFAMLIPGGRGPLLMLLLTLALMASLCLIGACAPLSFSRRGILWVLMGSALGWGLLQVIEPGQTLHTLNRLQEFYAAGTEQAGDASTLERLDLYRQALQAFCKNPVFGLGIGSWPTIVSGGIVISHPHNIFLEVLAELGVVGVLFMGSYVWYFMRHVSWRGVLATASGQSVLALWFFSLLNAQKSGDLIDNIFLFVWSAVLLALSPSTKSALKLGRDGMQPPQERQTMTSKPHHLENATKYTVG